MKNNKSGMSTGLQEMLGSIRLSAIVEVKVFHVFEVSETEREVHVECSGIDWASAFPLGLYFFGSFSDEEINAMRKLYLPRKMLWIEGPYSILLPEDGGITVYDCTTTELADEDIAWLKAATKRIGNI